MEHTFNKHRTDVTTDLGIERLEMLAKQEKPFIHIIFYQAPHYPEQPSEEYYALYKDKEMPYPVNYQEVDPYTPTYSPYSLRPFENCPDYQQYGKNMQEYLKGYNAMVTQIDVGVGKILNKIDALGLSEDTLVLFSSDHGDMQGSHGLTNKCLPYEESCGIPLIIKTPNCNKGTTVDTPVSCIDFYPTCVHFANAFTERDFEGRSLLPFLNKESSLQTNLYQPVFAENESGGSNWAMIRDKQYKLVVDKNTLCSTLLFDIDEDPFEMNNLVNQDDYQQIRDELEEKVIDFIEN